MDKLLTIKDVCERLSVSRAWFYRLVNAGKLKTIHLSDGKTRGAVRVKESDLQAYIDSLNGHTEETKEE